jgi:hypothetical protein
MLADVLERARRELAHSVARASGRQAGGSADPRGPLVVLTDLDRVLDTIASDAPLVIPETERAAIVATVSITVKEALLLHGPMAPLWIGFGPEDRIGLSVEPQLADALATDGARVDGALGARSRRLARDGRDGSPPSERPGALVTVATVRLADPTAQSVGTFAAIRVGVGLQQLAGLATRDVDEPSRQAPTATGTLE